MALLAKCRTLGGDAAGPGKIWLVRIPKSFVGIVLFWLDHRPLFRGVKSPSFAGHQALGSIMRTANP